jgi:predicted TIM-barrel fold metal-dependent hydrolase
MVGVNRMNNLEADDPRIIDCHVHFTDLDSERKFLEIMDAANINKINLLSTIDAIKLNFNPELIYMKRSHPDFFYIFGALEYPTWIYSGTNLDSRRIKRTNLAQQVDELIDIGFDGIKMIEAHAKWRKYVGPLNNNQYKEYFKHVESLQFPLLMHARASELRKSSHDTELRQYEKKQYPLWVRQAGWQHPLLKKARLEVADMIQHCPDLKVIFAHFGGLTYVSPEQTPDILDNYKNLYLDVTPGMMMYNWTEKRDEWREIFLKYQDRILFGTDVSSRQSLDVAVDLIHRVRRFLETEDPVTWGFIPKREPTIGFNLPKHVLRKIYAENFERIVGKNPKELKVEAAIAKCERMEKMMRKAGPWPYRVKNIAEQVGNLLRQNRDG